MKISESTVEILKNFSTINSSLLVKPGNVLRTISPNKAILAVATINETFSKEFGVYDLNKMLALLSMNKSNPEMEIGEDSVIYAGGISGAKIKQRFVDPKMIQYPPDKSIKIDNYEIEFALTAAIHKWLLTSAAILGCPHIVISAEEAGGNISLSALDAKGEIVDNAQVVVDATSTMPFKAVLKIENLKLLPGEYKVSVSAKGVANFNHSGGKVVYYIAVEQASSNFAGV